jgi:hypothetical protein
MINNDNSLSFLFVFFFFAVILTYRRIFLSLQMSRNDRCRYHDTDDLALVHLAAHECGIVLEGDRHDEHYDLMQTARGYEEGLAHCGMMMNNEMNLFDELCRPNDANEM